MAYHDSYERVKKLARSFAQEWCRPDNPDEATPALVDTLTTMMLAFYAAVGSRAADPPPLTWQKIDTAPKAELLLVALIVDGIVMRVRAATGTGAGWFAREGTELHGFTHWARMPLPAPPEDR